MRHALLICVSTLFVTSAACGAESEWVRTGVTGRLVYVPDAEGDRILDFSAVGYEGRGVEAIPSFVAPQARIGPISGDDTANIQAAIDAVSSLPLGPDGFRGVVQLGAGRYDIEGQLEIRASGVILQGAGQDESGTVLHGRSTGPPGANKRPLIRIYGSGGASAIGSAANLIDKKVPVGATSFRVDRPHEFQPGDTVRITRRSDEAWISELGMDAIAPRSDGGTVVQWTPFELKFDRAVTRVEGSRVLIDAPLPNTIEQQYGGGTIQIYSWAGAIENIGGERLRGESDFDSNIDEDHAWDFITIGVNQNSSRAQNVWVRDVHAKHFGNSLATAHPGSRLVTIQNAVNEDPKSVITGGRRYSFTLSGELGLVTNAHADEGRHDFVNNGGKPRSPNVFHNSVATNANSDSGPHQRWATGTLFDNVTVQGDQLNVQNRGNSGTGHGWAGANMVIWNSAADAFRVQNPPTTQNWLVGSTGSNLESSQHPGYYDSHNTPVATGGVMSLYEAQMNDARNIQSFEWAGGVGVWGDPLGWSEGVAPAVYAVSSRDYLIGDIDDFVLDGGRSVDSPGVDPAWAEQIAASSPRPLSSLDDLSGAKNIAFTIQHELDEGERVIHGSLALSMKKLRGDVTSDYLRLFDFSPEHQFFLAELGWASEISASDAYVGVVDLGTFLPKLQSGRINVQLSDDTGVDWALYAATVATPIGGAAGATVLIGQGEVIVDSAIGEVGSLAVGGNDVGTLSVMAGGSINILQSYVQRSNGVLQMEMSSTTAGELSLHGDAVLAGELSLTLAEGFTPTGGEVWTLVTSEHGFIGSFDSLVLPELDQSLRWLIFQDSDITAAVVLAGDYYLDGVVDAADYAVWRGSLGSETSLAADGDDSGVVDAADFAVWRSAYGKALVNVDTPAVPETFSLFSSLVVGVLAACRRPSRAVRRQHLQLATRTHAVEFETFHSYAGIT